MFYKWKKIVKSLLLSCVTKQDFLTMVTGIALWSIPSFEQR